MGEHRNGKGLWRTWREDYHLHGARLRNTAWWAIAIYRFGAWTLERRFPPWRWFVGKIYGLLFFSIGIVNGIEIDRRAKIGEGLHLIHAGNIKIHPAAEIGERCGMMHDVTLGMSPGREGAPCIGNDVFIGAGAKILGPVTVGDGAMIAANSLVVTNIPPDVTAIGVPARPMPHSKGAPRRAS
ncbi:Serine acetyltransferase [Sulfidibacter corallicola]|uniref:Serine acetyltransferase n=1 Tax=Sulfidibacter corallicola TaxID=2818388 RepID=A0A8A4TP70_SULCO|nr:serine acetyltransferase [Sulfidibacter corallicola]QTD48385.1 serine acetyltransferase [Sulfidibacter corallicola]